MKGFSRIAILTAVTALLLSVSSSLFSYAYSPWTTMTGEKVIAVNPFVYAPSFDPLAIGGDLVMSFGVTSSIDVFVAFGGTTFTSADTNFAPNSTWAMARYDLGGNNIIALQTSASAITPQYHFFWENDIFAAEANVYVSVPYATPEATYAGAYLAPVVKIVKDVVHLYCEVDPSYTFGGSFALNVNPGLWFGLGSAGQISVACTLGDVTTGTVSPGVGAWYWLTFDMNSK